MLNSNSFSKSRTFILLVGVLLTLSSIIFILDTRTPASISIKENGDSVNGSDINAETLPGARYVRRITEEFDNFTFIDISNTTSIVNTYIGRAHLPGWGSNPKSEIRDVSNPDRTRSYNRFTSRCVARDGKFYIRDRYNSNRINVYASLNSFMANGNQIDTFTLPFNPHTYGQMIYVNGHLFFSNDGTVNKFRLSDRTQVSCSLSAQGSTSWGWGGGSQCGLTTDGEYIYTFSDSLLRIYNMNEQLLRQTNLPVQQRRLSTCFSAGHFFYPVGYSQGNMNHRVDGDSGNVQNYNDVAMQGFDYLTCFNYDYFGNSLIMTNGNAGNRPDTTWTVDNLCHNFGGSDAYENKSYLQSKPLYLEMPTIGAAKITWYEHEPQGTGIVYNMTVDGEHWVTMENNTDHIFAKRGSRLLWNATFTTTDDTITPYIDRVIIEYDLISDPEPKAPRSTVWQGISTPTLEWNFTDPDRNDEQSEYLVEIFAEAEMTDPAYNSSWINSSEPLHLLETPLQDGVYYWRVRTKDGHHAKSNNSVMKKIMIDVTKPVGNIIIEEGAHTVNRQLVTVRINATDNGSGVTDMQIINDGGNAGPWEAFKSEKGMVLSQADGSKTIGVRFRDNASIESVVFNDSVYLDLNPPGDINVTSTTHPDPTLYYNISDPVFRWDPPFEVSAIKGFSYLVDNSRITAPAKVLYGQNSELRETYPGEFPGLNDGTWFFHITCCDEYDQWGNASHLQFNIDMTEPAISDLSPGEEQWFNTTTVRTTAMFSDIDGFGLDVASIQYSYKLTDGAYSPWTGEGIEVEVLETGIRDNPVKAKAEVEITFSEGKGNSIRWRVRDLAGNGPVRSHDCHVQVDSTPVTFSNPTPDPDDEEIFTEVEIVVGIDVSDGHGSGVDGKTIEYCISEWGDEEEHFRNWTRTNNQMMKDNIIIAMELVFEPGRNNYLMWRALDAVGNGHAVSESIRIWVNSPPVPVISSPLEGHVYNAGEGIPLNATGTADNEDDELKYTWVLKNKTLKKTILVTTGIRAMANLEKGGDYLVYLYVDDGNGFNESVRTEIFVYEGEGNVGPGGEIILPEKEAKDSGSGTTLVLMIGLIVALIVITLVILFFVIKKRKKKEEPAKVPLQYGSAAHPYPQGHMPLGNQAYYPNVQGGTPPGRYGNYSAAYPGTGNQYGFGGMSTQLMLPPGPTAPSNQYQGGQIPAAFPPQYPQGVGPMPTQTFSGQGGTEVAVGTYTLPSLITDQGPQDLNRLSLPPGPSLDQPIAPLEPLTVPTMDPTLTSLESPGEPMSFPPEPPVPAPEDAAVQPQNMVVQCHSCGMEYEVTDAARPIVIECPVCHVQGYLAE